MEQLIMPRPEKVIHISIEIEPVRREVPEVNLLYAVLERAIADATFISSAGTGYNQRESRKHKADALYWLGLLEFPMLGRPNPRAEWSFQWVCDALGIDCADVIKAVVRALKSKQPCRWTGRACLDKK